MLEIGLGRVVLEAKKNPGDRVYGLDPFGEIGHSSYIISSFTSISALTFLFFYLISLPSRSMALPSTHPLRSTTGLPDDGSLPQYTQTVRETPLPSLKKVKVAVVTSSETLKKALLLIRSLETNEFNYAECQFTSSDQKITFYDYPEESCHFLSEEWFPLTLKTIHSLRHSFAKNMQQPFLSKRTWFYIRNFFDLSISLAGEGAFASALIDYISSSGSSITDLHRPQPNNKLYLLFGVAGFVASTYALYDIKSRWNEIGFTFVNQSVELERLPLRIEDHFRPEQVEPTYDLIKGALLSALQEERKKMYE